MTRRIDMRSSMGAHMERRYVRTVAARNPLHRLQREGRVAGVRREVLIEGDGDVDELHWGSGASIIAHGSGTEVLVLQGFDLR